MWNYSCREVSAVTKKVQMARKVKTEGREVVEISEGQCGARAEEKPSDTPKNSVIVTGQGVVGNRAVRFIHNGGHLS
jgi:hypothetical protein